MPQTGLDDLRVNLEDGRIYDFQGLLEHLQSRHDSRQPLEFWELHCTAALHHPTAAFAMRQLGLVGGAGPPGCSPWVLAHVPTGVRPRVPSGEEARFDAHDDTAYTRAQLLERYANEYAEEEIQLHWEGLPPWWRPPEFGCTSWNHFALARNLCLHGVLRTGRVLDAVLATDRVHYAPQPELAYYEAPQELGENATLSSPRIHCCCFEAIADVCVPGASVLDVGSGTGYVTAVLARMVGPSGHVLGLDVVEDYVERAAHNLRSDDAVLRESGNIELRLADGWWGSEADAPFDCIHVACSSPRVPEPLLAQLRAGGQLLLPLGPNTPEWQQLTLLTRAAGRAAGWAAEVIRPVRYVTMVHPPLMLRDDVGRQGRSPPRSEALATDPTRQAATPNSAEWEVVD